MTKLREPVQSKEIRHRTGQIENMPGRSNATFANFNKVRLLAAADREASRAADIPVSLQGSTAMRIYMACVLG